MKLEKAIEINQDINNAQVSAKTADSITAIKLGIEALRREQYHRSCYPNQAPNLLPGETPKADSP